MAGSAGLLLDVAGEEFSEELQDRIHAAAKALKQVAGVRETVPGMNNLLITFDLAAIEPEQVEKAVLGAWAEAVPARAEGRKWEVPVRYGGMDGPDLAEHAAFAGLSEEEVVARHAAVLYRVAAVGAMPGFVYLSGLDPKLARPRRATPRSNVPEGAVMIGGAQAGIMPCVAPSGWHVIGRTDLKLFDPQRERPATFRPGDRIRFLAV